MSRHSGQHGDGAAQVHEEWTESCAPSGPSAASDGGAPTTIAAITLKTQLKSSDGSALPDLGELRVPARPAAAPNMAKVRAVTIRVLTPERWAASELPPVALAVSTVDVLNQSP